MTIDPILDAWMSAIDDTIAQRPELAAWFSDRETVVATTDLLEGYEYAFGDALTELGELERHALVLARGRVEVVRTDDEGLEEVIREANAPHLARRVRVRDRTPPHRHGTRHGPLGRSEVDPGRPEAGGRPVARSRLRAAPLDGAGTW